MAWQRRLFTTFVAAGLVATVSAQAPKPTFEVASIRPTKLPAQYEWRILPGRLVAKTVPLGVLISRAYGIPPWRIVDEPNWVNKEHFDIQATSAEPSTPDQILVMLRTLLEERFRLKAQLETREVDADLLVLADRNGGKGAGLRAVSVDCETNRLLDRSGPGLFPSEARIPCGSHLEEARFPSSDTGNRLFTYSGITLERLANDLSSLRGRPTLDRTGLSGLFDIQLDYVADSVAMQSDSASPRAAPVLRGPSLEMALDEQLGFKLRRGRGRVEFLVIVSVQQPTEN